MNLIIKRETLPSLLNLVKKEWEGKKVSSQMKQCHFDRALRYKRTVKVSVQNGLFFFCLINYGVSHFQFIKFLALQSIVKVEADNSAWNEIKLIGGRICSSVGLIVVCVHTNNKRCDPGCNKKGKLSKIWLNSF